MPRKGPIPRREVLPDPIYGSRLAARFVNRLMYDGKKGAAEKIFYGALEVLAEKTGEEALRAFEKALENVKPHLEVKARRVGGATYQVPMEVRPDRQVSLSIRWLITYARSRGEKGMANKLSAELLDAFNNRGGAVFILKLYVPLKLLVIDAGFRKRRDYRGAGTPKKRCFRHNFTSIFLSAQKYIFRISPHYYRPPRRRMPVKSAVGEECGRGT